MSDVIGSETQILPVRLTQDEIRARGERLAAVHGALDQIAIEEDDAKKKFKDRRNPLEGEIGLLAHIIRKKEEKREVAVDLVADFATGKVREVRSDTGEVVRERDIRFEEQQQAISFAVPKVQGKSAKTIGKKPEAAP